jgi:Flp pilus assembly protein TadD
VALSLAQKVKQKMPHSPLAANTLGWAYYKLGSFGSAVSELQESVKGAPNNAMFAFHLGIAYLADRQLDAARRTLQKALQDDPRSPFAASIKETLAKITTSTR